MHSLSTTKPPSAKYTWLYFLLPLTMLCVVTFEGWWFGGDNGKMFSNLFALACFFLFVSKISFSRHSMVIFGLSLLLLFSTAINYYGNPDAALEKDLYFYFKTILFAGAVYCFFRRSSVNCDEKFLKQVSFAGWLFVTLSIFIAKITGCGFYTYEEYGVGSKFYFPSVNELNFVYFVFNLMIWYFYRSPLLKLFVLLAGFWVYLAIGNKSFIALYAISVMVFCFLAVPVWLRLLSFILVLMFVGLALVVPSLIFSMFELCFKVLAFVFGNLSGGAEKFLIKASYLSPFSALVSERDVLFYIGRDIFFSSFDWFRLLFGMSYGLYGSRYAIYRGGDFSFSEIDPIDLFFSYGLLGLGLLFAVIISLLSTNAGRWSRPRTTLIWLFFLAGLMTGHIYAYVFPLYFFSMYLGLLTPRKV